MSRAHLSREEAEKIRGLVADNQLHRALTSLQLASSYEPNEELRKFVYIHLSELAEITEERSKGTIEVEKLRVSANKLREVILDKVDMLEASAPPQATEPRPSGPTSQAGGPSSAIKQSAPSQPILRCDRLSKRYRHGFRLPPITLTLDHGQILGLVGFNGAGKTTLLRIIAGDLCPTEGTVDVWDRDDRGRKLENPVTFVPQTAVRWHGTLQDHLRRQAAFFGVVDFDLNTKRIEDAVALLGLRRFLNRGFSELSEGFRTRAAIAAALVAMPGLLVLDEPLAPLDPRSQQRLLGELSDCACSSHTAIVVSSQHVPEIESIAHKILTITEGEASVQDVERHDADRGALFEVGFSGLGEVVSERVKALVEKGIVAGHHVGTSSIIIRFREEKTIAEAVTIIADKRVTGIRDISRSALARQYPELMRADGGKSE